MACSEDDHNWQFQGAVYKDDDRQMPGTSACRRTYYDRFFCTKCLERKDIFSSGTHTTYDKLKFNATPG